MKPLTLAADLYGCPNRCLHCWLSHMPNRKMEPGTDEWIVAKFRPYFDSIEFYSWVREPDYAPDYERQWERDNRLSVHASPQRFELASFWRLNRDPAYVDFLKKTGVSCVQLTFFGMEETTDRYVGRKGVFQELLHATDLLLENGIIPRWQAFINEENKEELLSLLHFAKELKLWERAELMGGTFRFFIHPGSCDGENRKLYPVRIQKGHVPEELLPYFIGYEENFSEKELCRRWMGDASFFVPHNDERIVLYVSNTFDVFFNFTHMTPEWRIGNLKTDAMEELVRRITEEDIPALNEAGKIPLGELVLRYGDPESERLFSEEDFKMFLLNRHLEKTLKKTE